jgi:hypothetical protein
MPWQSVYRQTSQGHAQERDDGLRILAWLLFACWVPTTIISAFKKKGDELVHVAAQCCSSFFTENFSSPGNGRSKLARRRVARPHSEGKVSGPMDTYIHPV